MKVANLRSTRSVKGTGWNSVKTFVETERFPIIIKPAESAGSYGVKLCHNAFEAEAHFHQLSWQLQGRRNREVLLQEYLRGRQYVVDHVSRDGVHKTTMVWVFRYTWPVLFCCLSFSCFPRGYAVVSLCKIKSKSLNFWEKDDRHFLCFS